MSSDQGQWFYAIDGEQKGPVKREQIVELVSLGTIESTALVWTDGMPDWIPVKDSEFNIHLAQRNNVLEGELSTTTVKQEVKKKGFFAKLRSLDDMLPPWSWFILGPIIGIIAFSKLARSGDEPGALILLGSVAGLIGGFFMFLKERRKRRA